MIIDELNKKISDIENLANDKTGSLESKVNDLTDGILMVADAVDTIPELVDEKIAVVTKEITAFKEQAKKIKTIKGDKGDKGEPGMDGIDGLDGKNGSPDTAEQIATKLNTLDKVLDWKVLKDFDSLVNQNELKSAIQTLENQTRFLVQSNASKSGGTSITGGVTDINGLTDSVTLTAGSNMVLNQVGNDIEFNANFTQQGKYMISGGATWSGTGLTYEISFLTYFFDGLKTANPDSVTLAASDPTDNRFDVVVVDEAGVISVVTGTASSSPEVPAIDEDKLQVTVILVEAGSTTPTIASEEIYMDDPTTGWTFSTYDTASPATGTINFAGTNSPKQGTECIEASTDLRRGARFVRATSFDAYQYTMFQVWVRFTGTAVATNKSLNVRFENSAGSLVGNTINLFSYGLQRNVLNTWQLVVVPITSFGALPATVKGLKVIMAGGTVGVVRQWDLDYMVLTNGSVPYANVPTIAFYKDDIGVGSASGLNIKQGTGMTITSSINPTTGRADYTFEAAGGGSLTSTYVGFGDGSNALTGTSTFTFDPSTSRFIVGDGTNYLNLDTANGQGILRQTNDAAYFKIEQGGSNTETLLLDRNSDLYRLGARVSEQLVAEASGNEFSIYGIDTAGGLKVEWGTDKTTLGDFQGYGNNTKLLIDDVTQLITITNVPTYTDETTAIGAGLTTGQVYKSYDGQNYFLAIVS